MSPKKPYDWCAGECPWSVAQGFDDYRLWCTRSVLCEPKKCERKAYAGQERAREMRRYREFPGNPFQVATKAKAMAFREAKVDDWWGAALPKGHCRWCGGEIWSDKDPTKLNLRRTWHPDCLHRYYLHTRAETQLPFIVERDGIGCRTCGKAVGSWGRSSDWRTGEAIAYEPGNTDNYWVRRVGPAEGPFCSIYWQSGLQVDHAIALGVVVLTIPEARRWRFWGPTNLQGLCHDCHVTKTKADVVAMKAARLSPLPPAPAPDA